MEILLPSPCVCCGGTGAKFFFPLYFNASQVSDQPLYLHLLQFANIQVACTLKAAVVKMDQVVFTIQKLASDICASD